MTNVTRYILELVKEDTKEFDSFWIFNSPKSVANFGYEVLAANKKTEEQVWLICLDNKKQLIGYFVVSIGTINQAMVHPREIFKRAMSTNSASIILIHNHTSLTVNPSEEDNLMTDRIAKCATIMGIELLDHIILCGDEKLYHSYKEYDTLPRYDLPNIVSSNQ